MKKFKAMLFDMDGVLVDSEPIHFAGRAKTLSRYGIETNDEELSHYTGILSEAFLTDIAKKRGVDIPIAEACKFAKVDFKETLDGYDLKPIDGILEFLQALQSKNIPMAIASSSSPEVIDTFVTRLDIKKYFKALISGRQVEHSKPAPDIYLAAAKALETMPTDCVVLEDSHSGIVAGHAAHCYCIGFRSPHSGNQDLTLANVIVNSIRDIDLELFDN